MAVKVLVIAFLFLSLFGLNTSLNYSINYYVSNEMSWSYAQFFCRTYYSDLSTVSHEDLKPLSDKVSYTYYWTGLFRDSQSPSVWKWSGGEQATDIKWEGGEPNNNNHYCAMVKTSSAEMEDADCSWNLPFYCMMVFELILVQQESTWEEALGDCRKKHYELASLSSDSMMDRAKQESESALTDDVWIGLRFLAGSWFWVNGEAFGYKAWSPGGDLQCPAMNQRCGVYNLMKKKWKPADCEQRLNFLCLGRVKK
ncbi:putative C-type lectin domain family 20 member A [Danio rerio]|uniref:C-type lectin domain family 20 member A n=1 Tax=Danio rerio TaxID=7955 RepID=A0AC58G3Q6_DANRE